VLCDDNIGQPRTLLRISSGAKSRRVMAPPASRPITSSPACASGSTATPPAAPRPMTTTSVSLSLVAMSEISRVRAVIHWRIPPRGRLVERFEVVGRSVIRFERAGLERLLVGRRHHRPHAWIPDQVPADEVGIAAVIRVAESALARVAEHHVEELRRAAREACRLTALDVHEHRVLVAVGKLQERLAA